MPILFLQLLGMLVLGLGLALGYRRWIHARADSHTLALRGLLLLVLVTFLGGGIGSPVWWLDMPWAFAWDLPPLAARLLAAAGWSFVVICFIALEHPSRRRLQLVIVLLSIYLAPLVIAILLFHRDRFDFAAPVTYAFFVIAGGMTIASLLYLVSPPTFIPSAAFISRVPPASVRGWLILIAVVLLLWGVALFLTDQGPSALIWVWQGDLLTSRLIAVMLLAIAGGAVLSLRDSQTARQMLAGVLTYGLGVAIAGIWNALANRPIPIAYVAVFSIFCIGSAILLRQKPTLIAET